MRISNKTSENKSKQESMEVIVIDKDDKFIQTHSNSAASYSHGPHVKADATTAKRECKKSPNTSWSPASIRLEKKGEDYWTEYVHQNSEKRTSAWYSFLSRLPFGSSTCVIYLAYMPFSNSTISSSKRSYMSMFNAYAVLHGLPEAHSVSCGFISRQEQLTIPQSIQCNHTFAPEHKEVHSLYAIQDFIKRRSEIGG